MRSLVSKRRCRRWCHWIPAVDTRRDQTLGPLPNTGQRSQRNLSPSWEGGRFSLSPEDQHRAKVHLQWGQGHQHRQHKLSKQYGWLACVTRTWVEPREVLERTREDGWNLFISQNVHHSCTNVSFFFGPTLYFLFVFQQDCALSYFALEKHLRPNEGLPPPTSWIKWRQAPSQAGAPRPGQIWLVKGAWSRKILDTSNRPKHTGHRQDGNTWKQSQDHIFYFPENSSLNWKVCTLLLVLYLASCCS